MRDPIVRQLLGTMLFDDMLEHTERRRRQRRHALGISLLVIASLLLGAGLARAERYELEPMPLSLTSTTPRLLTLSERDLYRINERALALAQGYRVELSLCSDRVDELVHARDEIEKRILEAPALVREREDDVLPWWVPAALGAGVGVLVGVGAICLATSACGGA